MTEGQLREMAHIAIEEDKEEWKRYMSSIMDIVAEAYDKGLLKGIEICERINKQKGISL